MLLQRIVPLILITLLVTAAVSHAQVTVSVRDTSARPADTLLIPVDLSGLLPGDEIFGVQATIKAGTPAVTVLGIQTTGTLSDGASALFNTTTSKLAIASTTPMTTNGVLVFLRIAVSGNPGYTYTLSVTGLQVNEGTPAATPDNGSLYIRYVSVVPHSPSGVVLGDTIQFSVSGNAVQPLGWSTTAPGVGSIDANGKFIALAQGVVRVRVTDAEGKKDSTSPMTVNPTTLRSLTVSIPDTSQVQTIEIGLPVRVTDVTGLGITSAQFTLTYNATYLQYTGASAVGTVSESWPAPIVNSTTPGTLNFALAGTTELTGAGTLIVARFLVKPASLSASQVNLSNVEFNEGIFAAIDNGVFTPLPAPVISPVPDRFTALMGETVPLVFTTGGTGPYTYTSSNAGVAQVDPVSGLLTVITRGAVQVVATDAQGFPGSSDTIHTFDFVASLSDVGVLVSDSVDVPLLLGNTTGLNISAFQFRLGYDTSIVQFRGVITTGGLADGYAVDARDTAGMVSVAGAGTNALSGSGRLLSLRFLANPGAVSGDSSTLALVQFQFNEPGPSTPAALPVSGVIRIADSNAPPVFTSVPADTTIEEGGSLTVSFSATDPDLDPLSYVLLGGPSGASLDGVSGDFTYSPSYADSGSYLVRVSVSDGFIVDTAEFRLTVVNVNRVPTFTTFLPDTSIAEGETLSFTYAVLDPDGDTIRFHLLEGPAGASLDSITGAFQYQPGFADSGLYVVRVAATDWEAGDTALATLTVDDVNRPPVFTFELPDTALPEGGSLSYTYAASDPDGETVRYHAFDVPAGAVLDSVSGVFSWNVPFQIGPSVTVTLYAVSGNDSTLTTALVTISNVNRAPVFDTELPDTSIAEGQPIGFQYTASDPDGEPLRFFLVSGPSGGSVDSVSGTFAWTPGYTDAGTVQVIVRVTDGAASDTASAQLTVTNVNRAPVFTTVLDPDSVLPGINVGTTYAATDPDGDPVRYHLLQAPTNATLDSLSGVFAWTPAPPDTGAHTVRVIATDGSLADTAETVIFVLPEGTTSVVEGAGVPHQFTLGQNYPNPFNPSTTIRFGVPMASIVRLEVLTVLGQSVAVLQEGPLQPGFHSVQWHPTVSTGLYFYRLEARPLDGAGETFVSVKRMVLLK